MQNMLNATDQLLFCMLLHAFSSRCLAPSRLCFRLPMAGAVKIASRASNTSKIHGRETAASTCLGPGFAGKSEGPISVMDTLRKGAFEFMRAAQEPANGPTVFQKSKYVTSASSCTRSNWRCRSNAASFASIPTPMYRIDRQNAAPICLQICKINTNVRFFTW